MLEERHKMSQTVPGTQSLHSFIPLSACMVEVRHAPQAQFAEPNGLCTERVLIVLHTLPWASVDM